MKEKKMFNDAHLPEPNYILEIENPPKLVQISQTDEIFFCNKFTNEKRIRAYIYQMLLNAKKYLPNNYYFKIYEAYRPLDAQIQLWNQVVQQQKKNTHKWTVNQKNLLPSAMCFVQIPIDKVVVIKVVGQ